jgi:hypothetical protein
MTDNDIVKEATEAYRQDLDAGCYVGDLLGIITRKNEEIERITLEYAGFKAGVTHFADIGKMLYNEARAEAAKEFAERLKRKSYIPKPYAFLAMVDVCDIDNLVKEMTEGQP